MLCEDVELFAHVVAPDHVGVFVINLDRWLAFAGVVGPFVVQALVAVGHAVEVEANDLAEVGHDVDAVANDGGRRAHPQEFPVADLACAEFVQAELPDEIAGLFVEAVEDGSVAGVFFIAGRLVVGADEDLAL